METLTPEGFCGWSQALTSPSSAILAIRFPELKSFPTLPHVKNHCLPSYLLSWCLGKLDRDLLPLWKLVPFISAENQLALSSANMSGDWLSHQARNSLLSVGRGLGIWKVTAYLFLLKDMLSVACNQNLTTEVRNCCELPTSTREPVVRQLLVYQLSVTGLSPGPGSSFVVPVTSNKP